MTRPIISHPDNPFGEDPLLLRDHLCAVASRAVALIDPALEPQAHTVGTLHDFGKLTPQFQAYIDPDRRYTGSDTEKRHSPIGTFVTLYALEARGFEPLDCLAGALAVARHHGVIPEAAPYTARTLQDQYDHGALHRQVERIAETAPDVADSIIETASEGTGSWPEFVQRFESGQLADRLESFGAKVEGLFVPEPDPDQLPERLYDRTLRYWSSLTLADKSHAAGLSDSSVLEYETLGREPLDGYIESLQGTGSSGLERRLNTLREDARQQAASGVRAWLGDEEHPSVATLRLPTGLGKTFTGITAALSAVEHLPETTPGRTVVYALPFTSIIEQTRGHFENESIWGADPSGNAFTVHHHLSETVTHSGDAADRDEIEFLGESWRSGVILTTFVQLFESLVGPSNAQGTKLSALEGSLVILDEPQALPKLWWDAMPRILELLTDEYGARVISMTATQPSLFDDVLTVDLLALGAQHDRSGSQTRETHSVEQYFQSVQRVVYHLDDSVFAHQPSEPEQFVGHEEAVRRIHDRAVADSTSVLSVCNTIESSRVLTEKLKGLPDTAHLGTTLEAVLSEQSQPTVDLDPVVIAEAVLDRISSDDEDASGSPNDGTTYLLTFNSRFRPFDRRVLIELADRLSTAGVPFVVVATQAIEAGVDLSFNTVFRDIAPLDSIVQAAGRCNRSFEWGERGGDVFVWTLAGTEESDPRDPTEPAPATHVYEQSIPDHLRLVADTLADLDSRSDIPDSTVSDTAVRRYFERLSEKPIGERSITEEIDACQGKCLRARSLIDGYETADVVVSVSDADEGSIEEVGAMFQPKPNREAFDAVGGLSGVRVSIPVRDVESAVTLPRLDKRTRGDTEGIELFQYTGEAGLSYELDGGGLVGTDDVIAGRFTSF
jgi:CRISPR-associated endonuclease Cas3-HD